MDDKKKKGKERKKKKDVEEAAAAGGDESSAEEGPHDSDSKMSMSSQGQGHWGWAWSRKHHQFGPSQVEHQEKAKKEPIGPRPEQEKLEWTRKKTSQMDMDQVQSESDIGRESSDSTVASVEKKKKRKRQFQLPKEQEPPPPPPEEPKEEVKEKEDPKTELERLLNAQRQRERMNKEKERLERLRREQEERERAELEERLRREREAEEMARREAELAKQKVEEELRKWKLKLEQEEEEERRRKREEQERLERERLAREKAEEERKRREAEELLRKQMREREEKLAKQKAEEERKRKEKEEKERKEREEQERIRKERERQAEERKRRDREALLAKQKKEREEREAAEALRRKLEEEARLAKEREKQEMLDKLKEDKKEKAEKIVLQREKETQVVKQKAEVIKKDREKAGVYAKLDPEALAREKQREKEEIEDLEKLVLEEQQKLQMKKVAAQQAQQKQVLSSVTATSASSTTAAESSSTASRASIDKKRVKKPMMAHALDDDDELHALTSLDSIVTSSGSSFQYPQPSTPLLKIKAEQIKEDDELLFSLTKKEELVFRRSVQEMRWEEDQAMTEDTETSGDEEAAAALWNRIGAAKKLETPVISVNDKRISLAHLEPAPITEPETPQSSNVSSVSALAEALDAMSTISASGGTVVGVEDEEEEEQEKFLTLFRLIEELRKRKAKGEAMGKEEKDKEDKDEEEDPYQRGDKNRSRMWRRRLIVVILLNFLCRWRRKFVSFNELFLPCLISCVLIGGMVLNSEAGMQSPEANVYTAGQSGISVFDRLSIESIMYSFCSNAEYCGKQSDRRDYYLVYSPKNNFTQTLMDRVLDYLQFKKKAPSDMGMSTMDVNTNHSQLIGVGNASEVERICQDQWNNYRKTHEASNEHFGPSREAGHTNTLRYPVGVIFMFEDGLVGNETLKGIEKGEDIPKKLSYTIRSFYAEIANTVEDFPFREHAHSKEDPTTTPYLFTGITGLQIAIDLAYSEKVVQKSMKDGEVIMKVGIKNPIYFRRDTFFRRFVTEPVLQQYEYPTYKNTDSRIRCWLCFVMAVVLGYVGCDISVAQELVFEQNWGSVELLKIHGMTTSMRWLANLICTAILRLLSTLPVTLCIHFLYSKRAVSEYDSPLILWVFLWLHGLAATCFNYLVCTGFGIKKTELSGLFVVCIAFATLLIPVQLFTRDLLSRVLNLLLCFLLPNWNLANGMFHYLRFELYEEGLQWLDYPVLIDSDTHKVMPIYFSINIFFYTILFYLGLTIYMDHILPREFSPKESWLFFIQPLTRKSPEQSEVTRSIPKSQKPSVYEVPPLNPVYGPRFRNVTLPGIAGNAKLDNVSFDIFEGEVTCIVGQVGSGKSHLLNVIAGVNTPSAGFVEVKGLKVHEYHDITNRFVSLCPQKSLLMETLSVEDHIRLCCMLHGHSYGKAKTQASFLLKMFGLSSMRRHNYKGLTRSDTKKLMLAMALSKSPSVLLLDNPVDQLDSESTLEFWKLLQELKQHRSIIVTCTKLEEAELYGDRIAVMGEGKLLCYGTPAYIKLAYGLGNIINLQVADKNVNLQAIQDTMHKELNGAKTKILDTKGASLQNDTIKFILPYGKFYSGLIEKLEDNLQQLQILKITLTQPNLWALFFKMTQSTGIERVIAKAEIKLMKGVSSDEHLKMEEAVIPGVPVSTERGLNKSKKTTLFRMGWILVMKKIWYYRQKHVVTLVAYILQIILLMLMLFVANLFLIAEPESIPKKFGTEMYTNCLILVRSADNEHTRDGWEEAFKYVILEDDPNAVIKMLGFDDNIEQYLAAGKSHSLTQYKQQMIVALGRDKQGHVGYYSSNSIHAAPIAAHLMMQAMIYMISPDREQPYGTVPTTYPFIPYKGFPSGSTQSNSSTILAVFLALILTLFSAPALRMVLTEKLTRFKMIQKMCGVPSTLYWFTHGIADFVLYSILILISMGLLIFIDRMGFQQFSDEYEKLILLYILLCWLCWAGLPYTYLISWIVPARLTGYGVYVVILFIFGIIPKIVTFQYLRLYLGGVSGFLRYVFYLLPPYTLTSACVHFFHVVGSGKFCTEGADYTCDLYKNFSRSIREVGIDNFKNMSRHRELEYLQRQIIFNNTFRVCCREFCEQAGTCFREESLLHDFKEALVPGLKHDFVAFAVNGIICWFLIIALEKHMLQDVYSMISRKLCGNLEATVAERDMAPSEEPEDVKAEHLKVDYMVEIEGDVDSEVYLVQDVIKYYAYTKGLDHVYFSVPIHAITGILGLPKTGKTTLLEVLIGQVSPSAGYVYKDNDLLERRTRKGLMLNVGYSPSASPHLPYLYAGQMLTIMGRLRGLSPIECQQHVHWWLKLFGMEEVARRKCQHLRKGQEQRLSCALSLIGDTEVIILDEPTAMMDNMEKYLFWNVIMKVKNDTRLQRTILFASEDAEEVQHQSSKVLVIDEGTIIAVGKLHEIFTNNNQGMLLAIRYGFTDFRRFTEYQRKAKLNRLKDHVITYLNPCSLVDEQDNFLMYHLRDQNLKLSRVYAVMEGAKVRFPTLLEYFHVFEQSLDDVILMLHKTRNKHMEEKEKSMHFNDIEYQERRSRRNTAKKSFRPN